MSVTDRIALFFCLVAVAVSAFVGTRVFENIPHIEDEAAYVWEAQAIAGGHLLLPSPPVCPKCFLVPFVIDIGGMRTAKYPPGWAVVLAIGVLLGARGWINPVLSGFSVWLIYCLIKKLVDEKTALLAALLTITSPFFVMNSGTLLAHPWSLFLAAAFVNGWLDMVDPHSTLPRWLTGTTAALSLGVLALTRPLTALAVGLPFGFHGLFLLVKAQQPVRRAVLAVGAGTALISCLVFAWQLAVTGSPWQNPYVYWWPYDTIGFGAGIGLQPGGYQPHDAYANMVSSLSFGNFDLFGWPGYSWIFMPFGLISLLRKPRALLVSMLLPSIVLAYGLYWIGSWLIGPRYYYEGLIGAVLLSAAGIHFLAGKLLGPAFPTWLRNLQRARLAIISGAVLFLVACNLLYYLPNRIGGLHGLYGATRAQLAPFSAPSAKGLTPALVIVHIQNHWLEYGTLLELTSPYLNTPFIFTESHGQPVDEAVAAAFPGRTVWHYYPKTPFVFFTNPLPQP